jgi:hypothetical protein
MLPEAESGPACLLQEDGVILVAQMIAADLLLPVRAVRLWHAAVLGASVPVTAVYEHDSPVLAEHNIRAN